MPTLRKILSLLSFLCASSCWLWAPCGSGRLLSATRPVCVRTTILQVNSLGRAYLDVGRVECRRADSFQATCFARLPAHRDWRRAGIAADLYLAPAQTQPLSDDALDAFKVSMLFSSNSIPLCRIHVGSYICLGLSQTAIVRRCPLSSSAV
jgi:hypothetical protein